MTTVGSTPKHGQIRQPTTVRKLMSSSVLPHSEQRHPMINQDTGRTHLTGICSTILALSSRSPPLIQVKI